jgi:hypothetical protein
MLDPKARDYIHGRRVGVVKKNAGITFPALVLNILAQK